MLSHSTFELAKSIKGNTLEIQGKAVVSLEKGFRFRERLIREEIIFIK
jgi:hypothetical protein